ncbi:hypothetical protein CGCSCA4_v013540 [Colletotrichum siamense]|uniref:Uncharacterized protein n=1 Tax=Colletotrichum siamense TaxID=690259 RepID=A0A9P5BQ50_COLSI|nr:hypothetical protein CGCTS75_v010956 [Colletotrichum tropicale]KAF4822599.1 hypothetical protein CGCSCA5_v002233 [Colletotrichum siamense]KAF4832709.1 hypothetical protein CGCSCA4_v013540 [Colletotrichum siamense]KAF4845499.1 hypothetical protein CGCSCA2_v013590 [Colletotrichum siamense]KAF4877836.1 hypothetical protein CGCSCA1_v003396 [Colletotrichum siamense]
MHSSTALFPIEQRLI